MYYVSIIVHGDPASPAPTVSSTY